MSKEPTKNRFLLTLSLLFAMMLAGPSMAVAQTTSTPDVASEPLTILLMVSDAAEGEDIEDGATDVMAVVHLDPDQQACRALNILPNTRVELDTVGTTMINQAMSEGGAELSVETVEEYLGIEIDHYGVIGREGVAQAIDMVGGITITNDEAFSVGEFDFPVGEITLSGEEAVAYAAYAEDPADFTGRLDRMKTMVEGAISSLATGGLSMDSLPQSAQGAVGDLQEFVETDIDLNTALDIANAYNTCVPDEESVETIPFAETTTELDVLPEDQEVAGIADPAEVQAHVEWLIEGTELP